MRLKSFRVQNYRSIIDSGIVEVDSSKTILVGPNEAGKSALLQALQHVNPPEGVRKLVPLRDYPRRLYNDISKRKVKPEDVKIVEATFVFTEDERAQLPVDWGKIYFVFTRYLSGRGSYYVSGAPPALCYEDVMSDCQELAKSTDEQARNTGIDESVYPSASLKVLKFSEGSRLSTESRKVLINWLDSVTPYTDEQNAVEKQHLENIKSKIREATEREEALATAYSFLPVFIYYNNYLRVRPVIHLKNLSERLRSNSLDDDQYDYGNLCLLKLLGIDVDKLSSVGEGSNQNVGNAIEFDNFREKLDQRRYELDAAEISLTEGVEEVWNPDTDKDEAARLRIDVDGQYLKVSVVDELGVSVELDQRSEGLQWLVSFFVIFFSEAKDKHEKAILLLDEPGLSLHGLKQRDFRKTIDRLSMDNQTLYTTHSPFMVGPDELDRVRVVEMTNRKEGTKVHSSVCSKDPAAILPLQEALGYDLAQSLFTQQRNLILEGLTDYWYIASIASLLGDSDLVKLNPKISLVPAASAGKVVYFATILHAQNLKVAAILDSDRAGDAAAKQETLIHTLGNRRILRTKDFIDSDVKNSQIEDLLRTTIVNIAKSDYGIDCTEDMAKYPNRSVVDILFGVKRKEFTKYKLAKSFIRWSRDHSADELTQHERESWIQLIKRINKVLK